MGEDAWYAPTARAHAWLDAMRARAWGCGCAACTVARANHYAPPLLRPDRRRRRYRGAQPPGGHALPPAIRKGRRAAQFARFWVQRSLQGYAEHPEPRRVRRMEQRLIRVLWLLSSRKMRARMVADGTAPDGHGAASGNGAGGAEPSRVSSH